MNENTLSERASKILSLIYMSKNTGLSVEDQVKLIKPLLSEFAQEDRVIGRNQILNHISGVVLQLS